MCGRFSLFPNEDLALRYGLAEAPSPGPRYNISPGQEALALPADGRMRPMSWGMPMGERRLVNVRLESLLSREGFRALLEEGRCLVPATGFFEWRSTKVGKVPHFFHMEGLETLSLAGVWSADLSGRERLAILTKPSELPVSRVHHRQPVLLPRDREQEWLSASPSAAGRLAQQRAGIELRWHQVNPMVNDPSNEGEDLVRPVMRLEDWAQER